MLSRQMQGLEITPEERPGLLEALDAVPDPRKKRGVRHRFGSILFISVCAVVSGSKSFAAIAEWAADTANSKLADIGIKPPNASTIPPRVVGVHRRRIRHRNRVVARRTTRRRQVRVNRPDTTASYRSGRQSATRIPQRRPTGQNAHGRPGARFRGNPRTSRCRHENKRNTNVLSASRYDNRPGRGSCIR
jgi:hypothetical protein